MFIGTFLDHKKAYDAVDYSILMNKLYNIHFREPIYSWLKDYKGILQGSVLGCLLFTIYINVIERVMGNNSEITIYADDTSTLTWIGKDD